MRVLAIRSCPLALGIVLVGTVTVIPPTARAADDAPAAQPATTPADLDTRVKELEETVRQLREQLQQLQQAPKPTIDPAQVQKAVDDRLKQQKPVASAQSGFNLQSADGYF